MDELARLKQENGADLLIPGSGTIYPAQLAAGLLNRLVLYTFPDVTGDDKRLFNQGTPPGTFKMVDHQITEGGIVIATYEPIGSGRRHCSAQLRVPLRTSGKPG